MCRETILQTKDLSSGGHPTPLWRHWANHWVSTERRISLGGMFIIMFIRFSGGSFSIKRKQVWSHLLRLIVYLWMISNIPVWNGTIIWTSRAVRAKHMSLNSEIKLFSPLDSVDALWLFYQCPLVALSLLPPFFLVSIVSLDPIYCCNCSFGGLTPFSFPISCLPGGESVKAVWFIAV